MRTGVRKTLTIVSFLAAVSTAAPSTRAEQLGFDADPTLFKRLLAALKQSPPAGIPHSSVPTVGCPSDGQQGPMAAPRLSPTVMVAITATRAARLAYYKSAVSDGVLAPRGWKCFARYGSSGDDLVVAPPSAASGVFSLDARKTDDPAVLLTETEGSTSGRFVVAQVAARVFPAARAFVDAVRHEEGSDPRHYVFGPWHTDRLDRLSERAVVFETPAGAVGLGAAPSLGPGRTPVRGVAVLIGDLHQPSLRTLRVRLERADADLFAPIATVALPSASALEGTR